MEKLIDLITFSRRSENGHDFYSRKYFYGEAYNQYEGTPQLESPTPDSEYINKMDSNAW